MSQISKTRQIIDILASRVSLLILGIVTVWLGASVIKETYRKHQIQQEIARLKAEIVELDQKNNNLASLIGSFNDPSNIESEAKKRLNLKKPGEEVAVILRDKDDEAQNIVKVQADNSVDDSLDLAQDEGASIWAKNPLKWWDYITRD